MRRESPGKFGSSSRRGSALSIFWRQDPGEAIASRGAPDSNESARTWPPARPRIRVTGEGLAQLIQTQEKLADILWTKTRTVSIGTLPVGEDCQFPVSYDAGQAGCSSSSPLWASMKR